MRCIEIHGFPDRKGVKQSLCNSCFTHACRQSENYAVMAVITWISAKERESMKVVTRGFCLQLLDQSVAVLVVIGVCEREDCL